MRKSVGMFYRIHTHIGSLASCPCRCAMVTTIIIPCHVVWRISFQFLCMSFLLVCHNSSRKKETRPGTRWIIYSRTTTSSSATPIVVCTDGFWKVLRFSCSWDNTWWGCSLGTLIVCKVTGLFRSSAESLFSIQCIFFFFLILVCLVISPLLCKSQHLAFSFMSLLFPLLSVKLCLSYAFHPWKNTWNCRLLEKCPHLFVTWNITFHWTLSVMSIHTKACNL